MSESPTHLSAQYTVMMEAVYESFYEEIVDFAILDECFECHRALKLGYFFLEEEPKPVQEIKVADDIDIFGQDTSKLKFPHIICPQCQQKQEATSFAPHLNRCMGMRRESSKVACKRLAAVNDPDSDFDDNENDDDFGYNSNRKRMKRKQGRNSPRRMTKIKGKNWDSLLGASSNPSANHQEMTYDEKKTFLSQMCGVISKNTKKLCTKTQKCSLHTDEQRRDVRHSLLGSYTSDQVADDVQIDVDTVDEGSTSLNRFWDQTVSGSPSPPPENIPTTSTSKIVSKSTIYHRKRKSLGPSNSVCGLSQSSSAGSSFDPLEEHS